MSLSVAFVLPSFAGGGAERVTLALLSRLDPARFDRALVVLDGRGPLAGAVPAGLPVHDLGRPRLRAALPALIARLRALAPEVVFSTLVHVNIALLALRPLLAGRPRVIVREANTPSMSLAATAHPRLIAALYRRTYPRADAVLCNSEGVARELARDFAVPAARIVHLPNPVDVAGLRAGAARPLRAPGAGPRFVAAGRLTRQKGFDRLLECFARLPAPAHLTILGEGPDRPALVAQAARLGVAARVDFAGFEPSPWAAFAGADAFLLPSRWEGMANAALEALAVGAPVIATPEAGGAPELASQAPPGAVVLAEACAPFAEAMARVVPDPPVGPRASLLPAGFEPDAVAARLAVVLESGPGALGR